jgi:MtrB/PioB family decaheme-associated outer membrane protein
MTIHSPLFLLAALGLLTATATTAQTVDTSNWQCTACPYPKGNSGTVDAGVGVVSDASDKFGDHTGLQRKGAYAVLGGSLTHRAPGGYYLDVNAADLGLDTRQLAAQGGQEGRYALRLGYDELPRHFGDGARTPFLGNGSGELTLPPGFRAATTAAMPLATKLQPVDLGFKASRLELAGSWLGQPNLTLRMSLRRDTRDGTRPGYGSFFSTAAQLAMPVDHVTDQFEVAAIYTTRRWQASLAYQLSQFRNGLDAFTWANPFSPVSGDTRGQLALAPDNQFHQLVASAGWQVSPTVRASADLAAGRMTQNAAYLASTLNTSIAGVPARPVASLDGRVDTFNGSVRITATPIDGLRLAASVARDVRDNRTAVNSYPTVSTDISLALTPRSNTPFSLWQDRYKLSADWRGPGSLKLAAGVEQDNKERSYHEAVTTRETTAWARASVNPLERLSLALKVAGADRSHSTYGTAWWFGAPENPLLRKYQLADRQRQSAGLRADFNLNDSVSLGLGADYADDDYDQSVVGLTAARSASLSADLSVAVSDNTRITAYAQGERLRSRQTGSQTGGAPDWTGRTQDQFEVVGLSLQHAAIPDKLDIGADLSWARSRSDITVQTGVGEPAFPRASTALDRVKLYASYKLKDNITLTGSLWYEEYSSLDWRLDGVLPATVANLLSFGQQSPHYRVNVVSLAVRYKF